MVDVSKTFGTRSETIRDFFISPGVGFYIPLYQREYSWDKENVVQLIEDICHGVENLLANQDVKQDISFLGTIILVREPNANANINPKDSRALPSTIFNIIDGQQRISTIALLGCLLYQKLSQLINTVDDYTKNNLSLKEATDIYLDRLFELFSFDLKRGMPSRKPLVIRGSVDGWTLDGTDEDNYKSDVSSYIAKVIRSINDGGSKFPELPKISNSPIVGGNLKNMNSLLESVEKAHLDEDKDLNFPKAQDIFESGFPESELWEYERENLRKHISELFQNDLDKVSSSISSIIQLFLFSHYLLERCCFTAIEPVSDKWAFDMFQSLNATGTPLTAIETFKPLVVNYMNENNGSGGFRGSKCDAYFTNIEKIFGSLKTASSKSKLTNDYLSMLGTALSGEKKPSRQFSDQRVWLKKTYEDYQTFQEREELIHRMSDLALYWKNVIQFKPLGKSSISLLESETTNVNNLAVPLNKLASLCTIYLQDSGHKMANAILCKFYSCVLRDVSNSKTDFAFACLALASYFTLWRSTLSNAGLDDTYRNLLQSSACWKKEDKESKPFNLENLKSYLREVLERKCIHTKELWLTKAKQNLRYDNARTVCRFALFIAAHDTHVDKANPGLMIPANSGSSPYLDPEKWISDEFKTIEHIAPRKSDVSTLDKWDMNLYDSNDKYEEIGNLTLLPTKINSSAGNREWFQKWIYYRHLAEEDLNEIRLIKGQAFNRNFTPQDSTISLLTKANYHQHIKPIVAIGAENNWDLALVEKRTERICSILWDRISVWLDI